MAQVTIDASSGSSALYHQAASSWADAISTTTGAFGLTSFTIDAYRVNGSNFECSRTFCFFSLSGIPRGSQILSATLRFPAVSNYSNTWSGTNYIVSHTNSDPFTATSGNFMNIGSQTTYGSIAQTSVSTSTNNDIELTASAIADLLTPNIGGTAKIGLRHSDDIDGSAGSGSDNSGDTANIGATSFDLIVTYNPPGGFVATFH